MIQGVQNYERATYKKILYEPIHVLLLLNMHNGVYSRRNSCLKG